MSLEVLLTASNTRGKFLFDSWTIPSTSGAQALVLALHSEIASGRIEGTFESAGDHVGDHMGFWC